MRVQQHRVNKVSLNPSHDEAPRRKRSKLVRTFGDLEKMREVTRTLDIISELISQITFIFLVHYLSYFLSEYKIKYLSK